MQQTNNLVKQLRLQVSPYQSFKLCQKHHLEISSTCLQSSCTYYFKPFCRDCISHKHKNIDIRYLNTNLSKGIIEAWQRIKQKHQMMREFQRNTDINLGYCIDIFKKLKEQVKQQIKVGVWEQMVHEALKLKKDEKSQEKFLNRMQEYTKKYQIDWSLYEGKQIAPKQANILFQQIEKNRLKLQNINTFAQRALIFSSEISQIHKNINKAIKKLQNNIPISIKVVSLKVPPQQPTRVDQLSINLKSTSMNQETQLASFISNFNNIKSLQIKSNKVQLKEQSWGRLIQNFPRMKFLKQLRLYLSGDLSHLANLFQSNHTILRPIGKLHLKISDQKVNIEHILKICNCFELQGLWLTLSRCFLTYQQVQELIPNLKIRTSMTNLPMKQLHLILSINKLDPKQKVLIENLFQKLYKDIQKHTLQL